MIKTDVSALFQFELLAFCLGLLSRLIGGDTVLLLLDE